MTSRLPYGAVNVELFQRVKEQILKEPTSFDMCEWGIPAKDHCDRRNDTPCGSVCCIGGWAMLLVGAGDSGILSALARGQLRYDNRRDPLNLGYFGRSVFYVREWPAAFMFGYNLAVTDQERAQAAADYIDWICGTETEATGEALPTVGCSNR
jgi:hypothetical protein